MAVHPSTCDPSAYDPSPLSPEMAGRRPGRYVGIADAAFPTAWRECATLHEQGRTSPGWPEWCWLPTLEALPVVFGRTPQQPEAMRDACASMPWQVLTLDVLVALAKWRLGKVVLRFDEHLARALDETEGIDTAPPERLLRLPAWCVYVIHDRPDFLGWHLRGWFAHLDLDLRTRRPVLQLAFDVDSPEDGRQEFLVSSMFLDGESLADGILDWIAMPGEIAGIRISGEFSTPVARNVDLDLTSVIETPLSEIAPCVARLLYVASEKPDLCNIDDPGAMLSPAGPGSPRKPWTAAAHPTTWDVGYRIGSELRRTFATARVSGSGGGTQTGRRVRPHLRRAHWHTYRFGPKRAEGRLRWVMPVLVNGSDPDKLATVERFVPSGD